MDARREELGEECDQGLDAGLLHSLCFFPLLSYGSTAPLASLQNVKDGDATPLGLQRLQGEEEDNEDSVLKVLLELYNIRPIDEHDISLLPLLPCDNLSNTVPHISHRGI
jgi:hypothetical protein